MLRGRGEYVPLPIESGRPADAGRRIARDAEAGDRIALNVIMNALSERVQQARRYEMLRDRAGFLCITAGIGFAALFGLRDLSRDTRQAVAGFIVALGVLGVLISLKYAERVRAHQRVADALRHRAETICRDRFGLDIGAIVAVEEAAHRAAEPLHRLRLDLLWIGVCLAIAAFGVALFLLRPGAAPTPT